MSGSETSAPAYQRPRKAVSEISSTVKTTLSSTICIMGGKLGLSRASVKICDHLSRKDCDYQARIRKEKGTIIVLHEGRGGGIQQSVVPVA